MKRFLKSMLKNDNTVPKKNSMKGLFMNEAAIESKQSERPHTNEDIKNETYDWQYKCMTCGNDDEDPVIDEGKMVCRKCGTVLRNNITFEPEFRFYGNDKSEDNVRCGIPFNPLLPESSMGTVILAGTFDKDEMKRIRRYHTWNVMPYHERSRYHIFDKINNIGCRWGIPQRIINEAHAMYIQVSENSITRGGKRRGVIAACLYYACKNIGFPRNAKEIAKMFDIDISEMTNGCKCFQEIMTTNNVKNGRSKVQAMTCSEASDFIPRYCSYMDIQDKTFIDLCNIVAKRAKDAEIVQENTPPSIACGVIYLLSQLLSLNYDIKTIHKKCDISVVTINKCFRQLWNHRKKIIPKVINDMYEKKIPRNK